MRFAKRTAAEALNNFKVSTQYKTKLVLDKPCRDIEDDLRHNLPLILR